MQERVGPYRLVRKLGEGGMGVVYEAEDERLRRAVAIKTLREHRDDSARERFFREARAAASVSHPNVCQLFDIGDIDGTPYLVMELLTGEALDERLARGPLPLTEAITIGLGILTALEALHAQNFIHRDLKPSNVFLATHGVKLLDFGLARETEPPRLSPDSPTVGPGSAPLTVAGMIIGTPRYMAPEQLTGAPVDVRTDLFSAGAVLFEMISGNAPFDDASPMAMFHKVVHEEPPNLAGSTAIAALNRVIHRALAKKSSDRYQSAAAMAKDLREVLSISDAATPVVATRVTRLIVLPFRILRQDADTDFLAIAIPEAITASLAGLGSLVVRSPMAAARFNADPSDLKKLADEADVDVALTGTLLRAGEKIRVTSQLVAVPAGTVIASMQLQAPTTDIFELQDSVTQKILTSLPLADRDTKARRDVPATARAHECYLRAGQQGESPEAWAIARDLYLAALDEDPGYAPAWARLARVYLLLGKYTRETEKNYAACEAAVGRALDINPDLAIAYQACAHLEVSTGRAKQAVLRLLDRVHAGSNDPALFAALVTSLRFCGLLDASIAAHEQARHLDPSISTSAAHSYWMAGRYEEALAVVDPQRDVGDAAFIYDSMGRHSEAIAVFDDRVRRLEAAGARPDSRTHSILQVFRGVLSGQPIPDTAIEDLRNFPDPEGVYYAARAQVRVGANDMGLEMLARAEHDGFFCYPIFLTDAWLDPVRGDSRFIEILRRAEARCRDAERAFEQHPASRILTVGARR